MALRSLNVPFRLAAAYAALAVVWIVGTDTVVALAQGVSLGDWLLNTGKGLLFVVVTSAFLYALTKRYVAEITVAQDRLGESELRLKLALEASGEGFWDWNLETGAVHYSERAKAIFGYADAEIGPRIDAWQQRIHPDDRAGVQLAIERHIAGQVEICVTEHRIRTHEGNYRWALTRGKVVSRTASGKPLRMIGLVSDASSWHETQDRLTEALAFNEAILQASHLGIVA